MVIARRHNSGWHLLFFALAVLCILPAVEVRAQSAAGSVGPTQEQGEQGVSLSGRRVRVGLSDPRRVRGMLSGTPAEPRGFLREVAAEALASSGATVEFVNLEADGPRDGTALLRSGEIDVLCGLMVSEPRLSEFLFSAPVMISPGVAVVRTGFRGAADSLDGLRELRVVVPRAGSGHMHATQNDLQVRVLPSVVDCLTEVSQGRADAFLTTMAAANWEIEASGFKGLRVVPVTGGGFWRAFAYATRKDDSRLVTAIDSGLAVLRNNGRFDAMYSAGVARYQPLERPETIELDSVLRWGAAAITVGALAIVLWQWSLRRRLSAANARLIESERRYRGVFDQSIDAIMMIDLDSHRIMEANRAAERSYGYGHGELVGVPIETLVADSSLVADRIERVKRDGQMPKFHAVHVRKDGKRLDVENSSSIVEVGGKRMIATINRDVTATRSYEELVRAVIDASPHVAIQGLDHRGCVTFWNNASERLYGWTAEEARGRPIGDLIGNAESQEELVELIGKLERESKPSGLLEFGVRTRDGRSLSVLSEMTPVRSQGGEVIFVCVDIDVTSIRETQDRLADAQAKLASALQAAGMGTWSIDLAEQHVNADPSLLALFGEKVTGPERRSLSEFVSRIHPDDVARVESAIGVAMRGEGLYRAEYRILLPGAGERWLSSRGMPVVNSEGRVVGISGACVDATESKRAAEEADRLRDQLDRASRLESLGLLAGGLAHDFNNLLVGIRGNTEIAQRSVEQESEAWRALARVVEATERTAELTNQLLASAGHSRLTLEALDVNTVVRQCVELLGARLGSQRVEFEMTEPGPVTRADGTQLRQAVSNLLINAADACMQVGDGQGPCLVGSIRVRSGLKSMDASAIRGEEIKVRGAPGEYVFIEVEDSGCGMNGATLSRVFEPFFTTKAGGRGLGLSLVQMTARRHEGMVGVRSTPGVGTCFTLYLPLCDAKVQVGSASEEGEVPPPGRALVVDDQEMVRAVMTGMLTHAGWRVAQAEGGQAAMRMAATETFDVAFVDLTMPGMSGVETAEALRRTQPEIGIVFVSGYNREMANADGVLRDEVFVQKPFQASRLLAAAGEALRRSEKWRSGGGLGARASQNEPDGHCKDQSGGKNPYDGRDALP